MPKKRIAVYPGTFDPITNGHMDIVNRATRLVDHLVVGVLGSNVGKSPLFTLEERLEMVAVCSFFPSVEHFHSRGFLDRMAPSENSLDAVMRLSVAEL